MVYSTCWRNKTARCYNRGNSSFSTEPYSKHTILHSEYLDVTRDVGDIWRYTQLTLKRTFRVFFISKRKRTIILWTVNVKYTIIKINLYFMVYSIVLKFEKIWLSGTLNIMAWQKRGNLNILCFYTLESNKYIKIKKSWPNLNHCTVFSFTQ
jgi:hypothetical protein